MYIYSEYSEYVYICNKYMYSESVLYTIETGKEVLAGSKMMLTFYLEQQVPLVLLFLDKIRLPYSSYFCLKNVTRTFLRKLLLDNIL